ncbi:Putative disease resistance TIR-NBS-LRR class protein [Prunus dulcis]|uniref:ADP-ribosyl cyclase/cyclic ADP-ribose hydrolase n=1 Tax=Prunus dulcis TaxID=3755 RepID=A0A4Y1RWV0_PRUDU|nr:Putative disease resistance TIR-NBS-LRR class protein [Prunus dulcis]
MLPDDPDLERGTDINPELLTVIEQSRFAIIVLSTNYATSSWCLRELTHIVQSMKEKERIFPIFYDVDPSDVRHQRGSYGAALVNHERNCEEEREEVLEWRNALKKVANLAGWNSKDYRYDTELIKKIVDAVWDKAHPSFSLLDSSEILVGLDIKLKEIDLLLDRNANDVRFVGIWGMGGMGKTTLARLVYETISHNFEGSSFLANVREVYATHGPVPLQKQLLSNILREKNIQVYNAHSGFTMIKRCLCNKKVLLILDDVDQSDQLEMLIREKDCFGLGSRIIITTRDVRLLVEHGIEKVYEVMRLSQDEALYLFSRKAFRKDDLEEDYLELSKNFINYAGGLPLALKTLGSFLYKRSRDEWKSALDKLTQAPDRKIFQILKISYDGLEEMQKKIFLDVACFHKSYDKEEVIEILDSCGFVGTRIVIHVLIEKSLLFISNTHLSIHDLIQEMAWEIVRQESFDEPGGRSRLWLHSDIVHVLTNNTGTEAIEGIVLCLREFEAAHWNPEAFTKMCKLKLLKINNLSLSLGPKYLPNSLRFLEWSWYPSKCLPPSFQPNELAQLSLQHSKIDHLWNGIKYMVKLKSIDLSYSENLTRTPDFTEFFEAFFNFTAVEQMPSSNIHSMASLKELDMSGISMRDPPSSLVPVKNIELPRSWHSFFTFGLFPRKNPHPVSLEIPHSLKDFRIVIPGSEIPEWFSNQSVGDSVIETLPSDSNSKWVGFAFCALFGPVEEISAAEHNIISFESKWTGVSYHIDVVIDVASDHLWLILLSRESFFKEPTGIPGTYWREKCYDRKIRFHFEVEAFNPREKTWVKVKNCGVRILYEQDAEELNRTMKQYSNRNNSFYEDVTDCDFDKSNKVQGAITKRTREQYCNEAGPSGIGSFGKESSASKEELKDPNFIGGGEFRHPEA